MKERRDIVRKFSIGVMLLVLAATAAWTMVGCSKPDVAGDVIASVDGDDIKVRELREFLGVGGGSVRAAGVSAENKKDALDRLIAGRLLAREAKAKGLDNTDEYRTAIAQNKDSVLIAALFEKEMASKLKISSSDIKDEAGKLKASDKSLSEDNAAVRAERMVAESKRRKIEEDMIASAKKETPATINQPEIDKLAKGEKLADETVLAQVGGGKVTYGDVKALLNRLSGGTHGAQDLSTNAVAVSRMLERETIGRALIAQAKKQGIEGSEWEKTARQALERSILIDLIVTKEIDTNPAISDKDVADAYAQHAQMFVRDGKKIPLAQVKDQIRAYLQKDKQKKALDVYIGDLKKKAKVTVKEALFAQV